MPTPLELVSEQFPNLRERVAGLFERDPIFRELCEDYQVCGEAQAGRPPTDDLSREYAALQLRLETELLRYLHEDAEPPLHRK
jgi:hypothetical protein